MSQYWSDLVHTLQPYVPGEQPRHVELTKLNTNENPYPPSPRVRAVLDDAAVDALRLYPDPDSGALKAALAARAGLAPENVFIGNGSDDVLALAFMAFFKQPEPLRFPDLTYGFYPVYCKLFGIASRIVPLNAAFEVDPADYAAESGPIVLPNPNAPTGRALPLEQLERLLAANRERVVLIDEAYVDFGAESAVALLAEHPQLLVVQTFSKSRSLAGLRVGFAYGSAELIAGLERVKDSFNSYPLDRLAQAGALAALEDEDYFRDCIARVMATREWTVAELTRRGFAVLPSQTNFVLARVPNGRARALFEQLREVGVLVRYFDRPRLHEHLRISIGTDAEMRRLIEEIDRLLD
ncbi:aspartate aminotransferase [Marichromatium purpuratum 984]|uniref:Histidinol-phosphate aminotransferase n=1 Tax=Marichromatium purpuratum 984 TaxID=765910 RepID=W0E2Z2_MARPU|nr:histidinol-phosphate transaminase [Marichromatium purpuratum]AHF03878.1 aspartate aminotransferase [Marichromatium purpuratum 984]